MEIQLKEEGKINDKFKEIVSQKAIINLNGFGRTITYRKKINKSCVREQ